jgi:aspartate racemase
MRRIGLLGGLTWVATRDYYGRLNRAAAAERPLASADMVVRSLDFSKIALAFLSKDEETISAELRTGVRSLADAGCEVIAVASNTAHKYVNDAHGATFVHIGDAIAESLRSARINCIGMVATPTTMTERFMIDHIEGRSGASIIIPDEADFSELEHMIFAELANGAVGPLTLSRLPGILTRLKARGAEAALLACTEMTLVYELASEVLPALDTAAIHCDAIIAPARKDKPE